MHVGMLILGLRHYLLLWVQMELYGIHIARRTDLLLLMVVIFCPPLQFRFTVNVYCTKCDTYIHNPYQEWNGEDPFCLM